MSDTDSLSGISFYLDDSIFALASPATHARSTLSTTVSSNLSLSLPLSSPYLLSILPSSSYPASFILPSGLSFTRIQPLLPSSFVHPRSHPPPLSLSLSLARSFLLVYRARIVQVPPSTPRVYLSTSSTRWSLVPCRLSTPYTHVHHTIGPDLDTIRAVLNSTFRRFGSPPFLSRSPPFATATFFIPGEWATDPMCVRARVCVCACHRKRDNPSRVSQKLPQREILPNGFDSTPPFSFFSGFSFFFFFILFFLFLFLEKIRIALAISNVFRVQKSHPLRSECTFKRFKVSFNYYCSSLRR